MKILKTKEENDSLPTMQVTCTGKGCGGDGCGCLLEVNGLDIRRGSYSSWGETESYYYIVCPFCGKKTEVFVTAENKHVFNAVGKY